MGGVSGAISLFIAGFLAIATLIRTAINDKVTRTDTAGMCRC
jgi:hypothetical protein